MTDIRSVSPYERTTTPSGAQIVDANMPGRQQAGFSNGINIQSQCTELQKAP